MRAYSMDYRQSVAAARESGMSTAEVSEVFGCCPSWVRRLMQRQRESGSLQPRPRRQVNRAKLTATLIASGCASSSPGGQTRRWPS